MMLVNYIEKLTHLFKNSAFRKRLSAVLGRRMIIISSRIVIVTIVIIYNFS